MSDRNTEIIRFLARAGWASAKQATLAGDASNRRYLRLSNGPDGTNAVLMDAPSDKGEDVRPFMRIANFLTNAGFSAPHILAADVELGLLLLEDLGDDLFARIVEQQPDLENRLYCSATDVLVSLHKTTPPDDLVPYATPFTADMAALAYDWYLTYTHGPDDRARESFHEMMGSLLDQYAPEQDVLIQRDYHSENLLWLPERSGTAQVGLLDFQDAMLGHRAYDLVSLLQDARRDVSPELEAEMIARYVTATGQDAQAFSAAYHVLGAQRNLRILGVFARLCVRDGKAHYVDFIPRVWALLQRDLAHPALFGLRKILSNTLPEPSPILLKGLKDKCATLQTQ